MDTWESEERLPSFLSFTFIFMRRIPDAAVRMDRQHFHTGTESV